MFCFSRKSSRDSSRRFTYLTELRRPLLPVCKIAFSKMKFIDSFLTGIIVLVTIALLSLPLEYDLYSEAETRRKEG